jgi:cell wall-associated NlpC family hydrolase
MKGVTLLTGILILFLCGKASFTEEEIRVNVVNTAAKLLGSPYRSGGQKETGFDCSGFVKHVMTANKIKISRSSTTQISDGFFIPLSSVKPGDILLFKGANKNAARAGHSGIVHHISEEGIVYFIHSASSKGITIDDLNQSYYRSRFMEARDIISWHIAHEEGK